MQVDELNETRGVAAAAGKEPALPVVSAVYGGGGLFGIAYGLGVADALLDLGVPLRTAPSLGTSAGSWVASCLATDVGFDQLCRLPPVRVPNPAGGLLRRLGRQLFDGFQRLFHPPCGVLFTVPSRYSCAIGGQPY